MKKMTQLVKAPVLACLFLLSGAAVSINAQDFTGLPYPEFENPELDDLEIVNEEINDPEIDNPEINDPETADNELFKFTAQGLMFNNEAAFSRNVMNQSAKNALSLYDESSKHYQTYRKYSVMGNIFFWSGIISSVFLPSFIIPALNNGNNAILYTSAGLFGIGTVSTFIPGIIFLSRSQTKLRDAVNSFNKGPVQEKTQTPEEKEKMTFGINANAGGTIPLGDTLTPGGPAVNFDFIKGNFYSFINLSIPLEYKNKNIGFGFLGVFNYLWNSKIGDFYLGGGLGYEYLTNHFFTFGANAGYRFVTSFGMYLGAGAYVGGKINKDNFDLDIRPILGFGYVF